MYYELSTEVFDVFDGLDVDYMLFLRNTESTDDEDFDDDIGMHTPGVAYVMIDLDIEDSEMENFFVGRFNDMFNTIEAVEAHLVNNEWDKWTGETAFFQGED